MPGVHRLLIEILGKDKASDDIKRVGKSLGTLDKQAQTAAGGLGGLAAIAGIGGLAYFGQQAAGVVVDLAKLGAEAQRTETAFNELARQAGGSASDILNAIKSAAGGTVSEMDAMATANRGILLGLGANADQWEQLTEVARFRARAMGLSVTQAVNDITTAIGRESKMIADNLGFIWDLDSIMSTYASTLGKTADQLTGVERKQALMSATIQQGQAQIQAAGGIADDYGDQLEQMTAALADAKVALGEAFAPSVTTAAGGLADAIPGVTNRLQLLGAAIQGQVSLSVLWEAAAESQRIEMERGTEAAQEYVQAIIKQGQAVEGTVDAHEAWRLASKGVSQSAIDAAVAHEEFRLAVVEGVDALQDIDAAAGEADGALSTHARVVKATALAYTQLSDQTKDWIAERTRTDIASMDPYEMVSGQEAALRAIDQQREDNEAREERRAQDYTSAWNRAISEQQQAYERLRGTVESVLQPTQVTPLDMDLTAAGEYVDKWDENARRLDAIAQRGFSEIAQHADWAEALKIPPEVLSGSEAQLKNWAQNTANAVRDLSRPDLINVEAAADAVERALQAEAAREMTVDLVIGELQARGISAEKAKQTVQQMYGTDEGLDLPIIPSISPEAITTFQETTPPIPVNVMPQLQGEEMGGNEVGAQFVAAIRESIAGVSVGAELTAVIRADVTASEKRLFATGKQIWGLIEIGLFEAMKEMNLASTLIEIIANMVSELAASGDVYQGGGGEP